jgi:hypothetical protein
MFIKMRLLWGLLVFFPALCGAQGLRVPDTIDLSVLRVDADSFPVVKVFFRAEHSAGADLPVFDLEQLSVLENGIPTMLNRVRAVDEAVAARVALVLDRSASMMDDYLYRFDTVGGQLILAAQAMRAPGAPYPFEQAQAAILRLASQFNGAEDGLFFVSFSDRVDPMAPMQQDTAPLAATMRGLRATGRTAFYDALLTALDALEDAPGLRAVVALTDGSDNASQADARTVLARARAVQAPLYLVGLGNVDRDTLRHLAAHSRGACYFPSDGRMLLPIYRDISRRMRHIHCAEYRSFYAAQADEEVHIEVRLKSDTLAMRGHAGRYRVPAAALAQGRAASSLRWILLGAGGFLGLLLVGGGLRLAWHRLRPRARIPDLPELLPPPSVHPTPTRGPLTVTLRLAGESPMAWLMLAGQDGRVLRSYECSGHQVVLQLTLAELPPGRYQLCLHDGHARSAAVEVLRVRG